MNKVLSCGAILYSYNKSGELGIILGKEYGNWFPFKGCRDYGESPINCAIREVYEETCGLVKLSNIKLEHTFDNTSGRKRYKIGLAYVNYSFIEKFARIRLQEIIKNDTKPHFVEKTEVMFIPLSKLAQTESIHKITWESINFYMPKLYRLKKKVSIRTGFLGDTLKNAKNYYKKFIMIRSCNSYYKTRMRPLIACR